MGLVQLVQLPDGDRNEILGAELARLLRRLPVKEIVGAAIDEGLDHSSL